MVNFLTWSSSLGALRITLRPVPDDPITSPHRTIGAPPRPSRAPVLEEACLVVLYGESIGKRIPLRGSGIVVGRASDADLQLEEESVSRRHCRIEPTNEDGHERWRVTDLRSTNGTFVNDHSVASVTLQHGDRLQIGRTICKFLASGHIEAAYYEEIYRLVTTDGLTGLINRRAFSESLAREMSRAVRYQRPLSLVVLDIDHFKSLNDTLGHLAGDAALRQLGALLRANLRREDVLGRMGGEEFALLLPEIDLEGARIVADKIRRIVEARAFEYEGSSMRITVSAGVASREARESDGEELLRRADTHLYAAKRGGRNRIES
jgi:diguanylate cyclase (GGDEF)-like protein